MGYNFFLLLQNLWYEQIVYKRFRKNVFVECKIFLSFEFIF